MQCTRRRIFPNEIEVDRIGGKLESSYYELRRIVEEINERKIYILFRLGIVHDLPTLFKALSLEIQGLSNAFLKKSLDDIKEGRIPKETFMPNPRNCKSTPVVSQSIETRSAPQTPEGNVSSLSRRECLDITHRPKRGPLSEEAKIVRNIRFRFNQIMRDERQLREWEPLRDVWKLVLVKECLSLSPKGLFIDALTFITIFQDHIKAYESRLRQLHEAAAEGINKFFGGSGLPITESELRRYFILDGGLFKVNPLSINLNDYSRLGER